MPGCVLIFPPTLELQDLWFAFLPESSQSERWLFVQRLFLGRSSDLLVELCAVNKKNKNAQR